MLESGVVPSFVASTLHGRLFMRFLECFCENLCQFIHRAFMRLNQKGLACSHCSSSSQRCWDGIEVRALSRPVKSWDTRLIKPCLYKFYFTHWGPSPNCYHKVGNTLSKMCWYALHWRSGAGSIPSSLLYQTGQVTFSWNQPKTHPSDCQTEKPDPSLHTVCFHWSTVQFLCVLQHSI